MESHNISYAVSIILDTSQCWAGDNWSTILKNMDQELIMPQSTAGWQINLIPIFGFACMLKLLMISPNICLNIKFLKHCFVFIVPHKAVRPGKILPSLTLNLPPWAQILLKSIGKYQLYTKYFLYISEERKYLKILINYEKNKEFWKIWTGAIFP